MNTADKSIALNFKGFSNKFYKSCLNEVVLKIEAGVSVNSVDETFNEGDYGVLKTSCISNGNFNPSESKKIANADIGRAKLNPKANSIIFSRMNTPLLVGNTAYIKENYDNLFLPDRLWQISIDENIVKTRWIAYLLSSDKYSYKVRSLATGTSASMKNISKESLLSLDFIHPSLEEQQKIADFFTLLDHRIEKQQEKVEALREYKKGMLQKIFSRELRFKDENGEEFPEWSNQKLSTIISKKKKGEEAQYAETGNLLLHNEYLASKKNYLYVINEPNVENTDVLILWDGSQAGNVYTGYEGVLGSTFVSLKLKRGYSNIFLTQVLQYRIEEIKTAWREGSGVPHISKDFLNLYKVEIPCIKEQQKIADFLSKLDTKIEKEEAKLEALQEQKKGFMQQMFI